MHYGFLCFLLSLSVVTGFMQRSFLHVSNAVYEVEHCYKWPPHFIIDYWGAYLDERIPCAILSCNEVSTCGFSSDNCVTKKVID